MLLPRYPFEQHNYTDALHRIIDYSKNPRATKQINNLILEFRRTYRKSRNLIATLRGLFEAMDQGMLQPKEIVAHQGIKADNSVVSCKAGCNFCCRVHNIISQDEATLLVHSAKEKNIVINKERLQKQKGLSIEAWDKLPSQDKQCVFLNNGLCSVYSDRPSSCRKYRVISPPMFCDTENFPGAQTTLITDNMAEVITTAIHSESPTDLMANMILNIL